MKYSVMLNPKKLSNYAYYEPNSGLHLTLAKKMDNVIDINDNLAKALINGTIVPINFIFDPKTKEATFLKQNKPTKKNEDESTDEPKTEEDVDNVDNSVDNSQDQRKTRTKKA